MRTVFHGGRLFDGTMAPLAEADVVIEDGRIVGVGPGLDGDEDVDCTGKALLPGLFDTHVHVTGTYEDDELTIQHRPFSYGFYQTPKNLLTTIELGTLEPGKRADLVVVEGDALEVATIRDRVREVWKDGALVAENGEVRR